MDIKQARYPQASRSIPVSLPPVQRCRWHKPPGSQSSRLSPSSSSSSSTLSSSLHVFLLLDDFFRIFNTLFTLFIWSQGCREGMGSPQLLCLSSSSSPGRRDRQKQAGHWEARKRSCVCMRACLCVKSFFPPKESFVGGGEGESGHFFCLMTWESS